MDDDDDDDEQLIVLEDDGPDLDDDPGRYAEDAMPDDFFNQFMKHKSQLKKFSQRRGETCSPKKQSE